MLKSLCVSLLLLSGAAVAEPFSAQTAAPSAGTYFGQLWTSQSTQGAGCLVLYQTSVPFSAVVHYSPTADAIVIDLPDGPETSNSGMDVSAIKMNVSESSRATLRPSGSLHVRYDDDSGEHKQFSGTWSGVIHEANASMFVLDANLTYKVKGLPTCYVTSEMSLVRMGN